MKVVYLNQHSQSNMASSPTPIVLALGFFDGVHKGHQKVIATARKIASQKGYQLAVMTFNRHASRVFNHSQSASFRYLTTLKQKIELVRATHADILYVIDFTKQFAALPPKHFVDQYVIGLNAKVVVAGFDYTFGRGGTTTIDSLAKISGGKVKTVTVNELASDQLKISSTRIRHLVRDGNIQEATRLLGHPYETTGKLIHAQTNGLSIVNPSSRLQQLPESGRYLCEVRVADHLTKMPIKVVHARDNSHGIIYIDRRKFNHLPHVNSLPVKIQWLK
ncbi:FAD synthetase family protein [Lentilactobacillus buchneri]|uniref:Riboflavin biosynthesis protein n=1 Tax=Lentilactobacillus buchneri subsp. silagei CD034 TaxID=1071400 RepID=J9W819_LENBU|nr:FAD synthetase family protein [Lentilactobacillus buchneri]MCC6101602.1 FAD synthetase family protein [Lactobacillus sp.]AFS00995.1 bifunctional protein: riboflavin kinase [Lentilactobacillus buchneri subsp. silagei CD034]MCT2899871.1 FAD synthetase [Lentilactobacillus buchneri]MCT3542916.1 FAD synthetase [Lentilactobacillus buchneri]MCT3544385.1 FAD synthetase [Lentilactobacillus buchneri]